MFPCKPNVMKRQRSPSPDRVTCESGVQEQEQCEDGNDYLSHWVASARFWDTLPRIYLTRRALDELNRRNRQQRLTVTTEETAPPRRPRREIGDQEPDRQRQRFARGGGPDLTGLRGWPHLAMSDRTSPPSIPTEALEPTQPSKKTSPYDANYELKLNQAGIFLTRERDDNNNIVLPCNYDDVMTRLNDARKSLSPSRFTEEDFQRFSVQTQEAALESETIQRSMPIIEGNERQTYSRLGGQFNNLEPVDAELAMAVPDSYDGVTPLLVDHRVLHDLGRHIVPSTDTSRPAAPNFFLEGKSRMGRFDVAKRQAAHVGALGARGMVSLQNYLSPTPGYDRNALSFTSTYYAGILTIYTMHATGPRIPGGPPQYYMTQLRSFAMTDNSTTFREGATHYRNARDMAQEQRNALVQQANGRARQMPTNKRGHLSQSTMNTPSMHPSVRSGSLLDCEIWPEELASVEDDQDDPGQKKSAMPVPVCGLVTSIMSTASTTSIARAQSVTARPTKMSRPDLSISDANRKDLEMTLGAGIRYSRPRQALRRPPHLTSRKFG